MSAVPTCPSCGSNTIRITVEQTATVVFFEDVDGLGDHAVDEVDGDVERDVDSRCWCGNCGLALAFEGDDCRAVVQRMTDHD